MKLVIVGGVAGGASAAARARRLDEHAEIVMLERGEFISFANCGLPYHVGGVIPQRDSLLLMTPERFRARFNVEVRTRQEVTAIWRDRKTVTVKKLETGETYEERYDTLILATGSRPLVPPIPGVDDPAVQPLWTMADMDRVLARLQQGARRATVIGAGFIGVEVAENLKVKGLEVDLVDVLPHVLRTLDAEMAQPLHQELVAKGIRLHLNQAATAIERPAPGGPLTVALQGGERLETDLVILAVGVRPNSELAAAAGLELSAGKGIAVDEHLRTSDPSIFAVGDVIAVRDAVTGTPTLLPLAGPANRQGRLAAENACGRASRYRGTLGTSVVQVFGLTAASVGRTAEALAASRTPYRRVYVHPMSNAGYYPGAEALHMKLLCRDDGTLLGAQVVGRRNVEKQVDVLATAMKAGLTVYDLAELELAYAPPYGSAKSPINVAGMAAANMLRGDSEVVYADALPKEAVLLDVREPAETDLGVLPGACLIPLGQLRQRLGELPRDRQIVVYCKVGLRGYVAERILRQHGFRAANLSGGWVTWRHTHPVPPASGPAPLKTLPAENKPATPAAPAAATPAPAPTALKAAPPESKPAAATEGPAPLKALPPESKPAAAAPLPPAPERQVDVSALQCPGPVVRVREIIETMKTGEVLAVTGALPFRSDLEAWCACAGHEILALTAAYSTFTASIRKGSVAVCAGPAAPSAGAGTPDRATLVVFSNDLDKVTAAFIIAIGMASLGTKVSMFFTFWGLSVLRKDPAPITVKDVLSAMFGFMLPRGAGKLGLSKMHMLGLGTSMMRQVMARKKVSSLPELMQQARDLGVKYVACDMAMEVLGLQRHELLDEVDEVAGVATFAAMARASGTTLFV